MRRLTRIAVVAALVVLTPGVSAAAVYENESGPTTVAAWGSTVAWSSPSGSDGAHRIHVITAGGPRRTLSAAGVQTPYDLDVGPDRRGRPVVVYSRCPDGVAPPSSMGQTAPVYGVPRPRPGCDAFRYDLTADRESRIPGASSAEFAEMRPAIWRGRIVFARASETRTAEPVELVEAVDGRVRSIGVAPEIQGAPVALDLRGRLLAMLWQRFDGRHRDVTQDIRTIDLRSGRRRVLARQQQTAQSDPSLSSMAQFGGPAWGGSGELVWSSWGRTNHIAQRRNGKTTVRSWKVERGVVPIDLALTSVSMFTSVSAPMNVGPCGQLSDPPRETDPPARSCGLRRSRRP